MTHYTLKNIFKNTDNQMNDLKIWFNTTRLSICPYQKANELTIDQWVIYKLTSGNIELKKGTRSYSVATKGGISTNNAAARTAFIEGGHGLGRIPVYDAWPKIKAGTLEQVMSDYQLTDINIYGVFLPGTGNTKKVRLLLDFLKDYFAKQQVQV